jgi:AP-1 complex subunit mu
MAGAVSALFLLDIKGRVLVWRDYRGDVSALQAERFFTKLLDKEVSDRPTGPLCLVLLSCLCAREIWR